MDVLFEKGDSFMNLVVLKGRINSSIDSLTRIVEVSRPDSGEKINSLLIPCRYWTLSDNCLLTSIKEGTIVFIRGRIDSDDKIGLYIIVETITPL